MRDNAWPVISIVSFAISIAFLLWTLFVQLPNEEKLAESGDRNAIISVCNRTIATTGISIEECLTQYGLAITEERR